MVLGGSTLEARKHQLTNFRCCNVTNNPHILTSLSMDISQITNAADAQSEPTINRLGSEHAETTANAELTEDEDTVANSPPAEDFNDDTVMGSTQNDTDGTVSEGEAGVGADTEDETSDISDDNVSEEKKCLWNDCVTVTDSPSKLTAHILSEHIDKKETPRQPQPHYRCHWDMCEVISPLRYKMICHVRRHVGDTPFFCFIPDCAESFVDAMDLSTHLVSTHGESRLDNFEWMTQIDQIKLDHMHPLPKKELRAIKKVTRMNEREITRSLNQSKVDFLKIQNVSVDDIVTEPLKKKGRTANAEINTDLREAYKAVNGEFKEKILGAARDSFKESAKIEEMPSYTAIDAMDAPALEKLHGELERKLLWAIEVNEILNADLKNLKSAEQELWNKKELVLDATISMELPDEVEMYIPQ